MQPFPKTVDRIQGLSHCLRLIHSRFLWCRTPMSVPGLVGVGWFHRVRIATVVVLAVTLMVRPMTVILVGVMALVGRLVVGLVGTVIL